MSAVVFVRPATVWWRDAVVQAQRGGGATAPANCKVGTQRGLKSVAALFLVSRPVIDPCLFVQMEAWCAAERLSGIDEHADGLWPLAKRPMRPGTREKTRHALFISYTAPATALPV